MGPDTVWMVLVQPSRFSVLLCVFFPLQLGEPGIVSEGNVFLGGRNSTRECWMQRDCVGERRIGIGRL